MTIINVPFEITDEIIQNVFDNIEVRAIDYWVEFYGTNVNNVLPVKAYGEDYWRVIDKNVITNGLKLLTASDHAPVDFFEWIEDIDATAADIIIQYGLFGEIVYS